MRESRNERRIYKTNSDYSSDDLSASLLDFDSKVSRKDLQSNAIEVTNRVGNGRFCDSIDLQQLGAEITNIEYEPETSPMAVWRPFDENAVTVLIPSTGRITIVGSKSEKELRGRIDELYDELRFYAVDVAPYEKFTSEFQINNIAAKKALDQELKLSAVAMNLGFETTEYDPNQFSGIVYRPSSGVVTLLFRTGNVIITANSYSGIMDGMINLREDLDKIGVDINIR